MTEKTKVGNFGVHCLCSDPWVIAKYFPQPVQLFLIGHLSLLPNPLGWFGVVLRATTSLHEGRPFLGRGLSHYYIYYTFPLV